MIKNHLSYIYATNVVTKKINAPKYVILQCEEFLEIAEGKNNKYIINESKVNLIDNLLKLLIMPKGLRAGKTIYEAIVGFQAFFITAIICVAYKENINKRRYETALLEICRKNTKTFLIGLIFILLFFLEPKFSKFYSVAPDGSLSREVKEAIKEIIGSSPAIEQKFKIRRDDIFCKLTQNIYYPLNYSNSRLDGKLPSVFLIDEVGALPNNYAIEAMRSGQLTILNKLGCIISTKYPSENNPFEDEVSYCKKVLDKVIDDDKIFSLLYEPDDKKNWAYNDDILEQSNPLALELTEVMKDLKDKRKAAIEVISKRENFITKHCNIIYKGVETESYIALEDLKECKIDSFDWNRKEVYLGIDLAMTTDNCCVSMLTEEDGKIIARAWAFVPEDNVEEKNKLERINYYDFIREGYCFSCGNKTVDYLFIENMILNIEKKYGVIIKAIGYDRYNCLSTAQKLENEGYQVVEIKQHSSVLHQPTKLLQELILNKKFNYTENKLLEINFTNAKCVEDTNKNKYVSKKKTTGKVDMVVAIINAIYLVQQNQLFNLECSIDVL